MFDAVQAGDGYTYSSAAIEQYFDKNGFVSPITGLPINSTLRVSFAFRASAKNGDKEHLICPIAFEPMVKPVLAADGFLYEETQLAQWIAATSADLRSPLTNAPMGATYHETMLGALSGL